jgi:hypothetical protein
MGRDVLLRDRTGPAAWVSFGNVISGQPRVTLTSLRQCVKMLNPTALLSPAVRTVWSQGWSVQEMEYVMAARAIGAPDACGSSDPPNACKYLVEENIRLEFRRRPCQCGVHV